MNKEDKDFWQHTGFKGGTFLGSKFDNTYHGLKNRSCLEENEDEGYSYQCWKYDHGHIAMTYTALCILVTLGGDLERIDKYWIIRALKDLQLENGRYGHFKSHFNVHFFTQRMSS